MYCRNQLGQLASLNDRFRRLGVGLAAISVDTEAESRALADKLGVRYPLLRDDGLKTALAYGVAMQGQDIAVPAVFVILPDGRIFFRQVGESINDRPSNAELLDIVDRALVESRRD
ncbi:peroxiredoxin family protein [Polyangium spumosum]|uniref:Redoxin domain-containing protein n=1 Tax=Polyangium spumosum TaxID=889282 RepID=A0A6N7Q2D3_9BACT|nr:redoxin domain-containing protein [Polyangium spumosum]MRG96970.1 redoxin domain-containing protein [Polyangium spumosum]